MSSKMDMTVGEDILTAPTSRQGLLPQLALSTQTPAQGRGLLKEISKKIRRSLDLYDLSVPAGIGGQAGG